ncbi:Copper Transporter integral membrane protein that functions in high affinity copper transport [Ceratobasidium sp. 392]|nr:Copper Transporter integral membrane protein that functions in high affinity copper transport [Ceratobasidium sp. 392]
MQELHSCHEHKGMDMTASVVAKRECSISMLWNWYTIDSCFLSEQWHIHSKVGFAFSVIGIFLIVCAVEAVRRAARNYDRVIVAQRISNLDQSRPGKP